MDDLNGLSWTPSSSNDTKKPPPMSSGYLYPGISTARRHDTSGRSTPFSASPGPSNPPSKTPTPANDSFANLVSFNSSNPDKNLSLVERQKKLEEERAKKAAENSARFEAQYGSQNNQFWDSFEQTGSKPSVPPGSTQQPAQADEDDLLAAFNASAPVDASTNFPVPSPTPSPHVQPTPAPPQGKTNGSSIHGHGMMQFMDDDDPFGLNQLESKPAPPPKPVQNDDDDFLGLLGKPVSEFNRPEPQPSPSIPSERESPRVPPQPTNGVDRAVAELVDMGFPADKASQALSTTESGTDIQAAVGWLLNQAHAESRQKTRGRPSPSDQFPGRLDGSRERSERRGREVPPWMREERPSSSNRGSRSPAADKDPSQLSANFGNNLLKTANSWWKTGSKRVQQVVNDLNTEHDPNTPKWMRDESAHADSRMQEYTNDRHHSPEQQTGRPETFTNEALLLEQGAPPPRRPARQDHRPWPVHDDDSLRTQRSPVGERNVRQPAFMQTQFRQQPREPKSTATRRVVEEQSAQAYVSPARRKRPTPQPPAPEPNVDLFESSVPSARRPTPQAPSTQPSQRPSPAPLPTRPKAPPRNVPPVSQEALASTHRHRQKGTEAYKRGDYAASHESFTTALSMLPDKHPINITILSNRAMTALKTGQPKTAVADADLMLEIIGPSKGEGETIDVGNGEPSKPMKDLFGKALMRKAEALEQLEKWVDAAETWKLAVQSGHGGGTSIQGRNRCEKAAGISKPAPKPAAPKRTPAPTPKRPSAMDDLTGAASNEDSAAVSRLRAANQAAERADEEKFALTEGVDAKLEAWKNGKQDNLRALLGSLDTVMWPEAGWKKVNMSELIMPNKVKIQYMKGISKVHPDKVCTHSPSTHHGSI